MNHGTAWNNRQNPQWKSLYYSIMTFIEDKTKSLTKNLQLRKNLFPAMHLSREKYDAKESVSNTDIESIFHLRTSTTGEKQS